MTSPTSRPPRAAGPSSATELTSRPSTAYTVERRAHRLHGDAEVTLLHAPVGQQLVEHALDRGHRQHHAVVARESAAGDTEHASRRVGHRRAGEPRIQAAVEADQTVDAPAAPSAPRQPTGADVAEARLRQPRWITSDREDDIADARAGGRPRARPLAGAAW